MLTLHVTVMLVVVLGLFGVNRFVTPHQLWAHWVAIAWLPLLAIHAAIFARQTLATMGGRRGS
jgi:hypothetical protein